MNFTQLATDFVHTGATHGTLAFHSRFPVFHRDFDGIRIFALGATFDAIHACHRLYSPPFTRNSLRVLRVATVSCARRPSAARGVYE